MAALTSVLMAALTSVLMAALTSVLMAALTSVLMAALTSVLMVATGTLAHNGSDKQADVYNPCVFIQYFAGLPSQKIIFNFQIVLPPSQISATLNFLPTSQIYYEPRATHNPRFYIVYRSSLH